MQKTFSATINKKSFIFTNSEAFNVLVEKLDGQEVYVSIEKKYPQRSDRQNKYYWGVVVSMIQDHTGYTKDEVHDFLKSIFLVELNEINGKVIPRIKSTGNISTVEFEKYMSEIRSWASMNLSVYIPDPNEAPEQFRYS